MEDINKILFSRMRPANKIKEIKNLTPQETMALSLQSVTRIVKEAGERIYQKSLDKRLYIPRKLQKGNNWSSDVENISLEKKILYIDFYFQYSNTDTDVTDYFSDFLKAGDYQGSYSTTDSYGNPRTYYFTYSESDKVNVIKSILYSYVYLKYKLPIEDN